MESPVKVANKAKLLAVGGIMQWLAMIAILVAQNAPGERSSQAGRAPTRSRCNDHGVVVENTELTEAIHDHIINTSASSWLTV